MPISANIIDNPTNESRDVKTWAENGAIKATPVCVGAGGRSGLNRGGIAVELKKTLDALAFNHPPLWLPRSPWAAPPVIYDPIVAPAQAPRLSRADIRVGALPPKQGGLV